MRSAYVLSAVLSCPMLAAQVRAVPPPLPAEHLIVEPLPPRSPHWVYVFDEAFANEIDSRIHLFDGDSYRRLGQIDGGFYTSVSISPDGATTAIAATYFARGWHGARTDVVEFTDNSTLVVAREIALPPKRAMTAPSLFNIAYSADAHFLYAAYMTPAASFGVLDPAQGKLLGEIDTAGCVLVIPSGPNRVSSLCESGRLLTVTLDAAGHEASRAMSEPFFDADTDPVFVQGIPTTRGYAFLSFLGEVHEIDFSGPQPVFAPPWSLVSAAEKGHWRPGAMQVGAIHRGLGRLYVPMHEGGEGTHKDGGTEMWVFDLTSHRRLARWPLKAQGLSRVLAVQVSQDTAPIVFAATETADLAVFDALTGHLRHVEKQLGQTPWMLLNP
ncbi:MAG TPA: amine dehydrogenase large subunit [Steroidobacteraceae bacterium]|jgi:methylamine dehydrogenase heavy chain|nr:amine dehydrogenase large subunit [Steroidobacteraceae bacterium]